MMNNSCKPVIPKPFLVPSNVSLEPHRPIINLRHSDLQIPWEWTALKLYKPPHRSMNPFQKTTKQNPKKCFYYYLKLPVKVNFQAVGKAQPNRKTEEKSTKRFFGWLEATAPFERRGSTKPQMAGERCVKIKSLTVSHDDLWYTYIYMYMYMYMYIHVYILWEYL